MGSLKGRIRPDHMPLNKYSLVVIGLIPTQNITFLSVNGIESELDTVDLPDRTRASGGQVKPSEAVVTIPAHHDDEVTAMEAWYRECQDPVTITSKKVATFTQESNSGNNSRSWSWLGVFITKRGFADHGFENEGELNTYEYTLSIDEITPLGLPL